MKHVHVLLQLAAVVAIALFALVQTSVLPTMRNPAQGSGSIALTVVTPINATAATLTEYTGLPTAIGPTVRYSGTLWYGVADPVCYLTSPHPCMKPSVKMAYFILDSGPRYRLILSAFPFIVNGTRVTVTGALITPSSWNADAWQPHYEFSGDIIVTSIIRA